MSKKRLGRGLDALLSGGANQNTNKPADAAPANPVAEGGSSSATEGAAGAGVPTLNAPTPINVAEAAGDGALREIPVKDIGPSRFQPRREFDDEALGELAASIKAQGIMQPVVVRPRPQGRFELIAGERRWRAAQLAGLFQIPAVIREVSDEQASAMALIENIQREDLNPLEEAQALARLKDEFGLTQQQIADTVGKSRAAVTNLLRLLNLTGKVRDMLANGDLEMGHARALLSLDPLNQERAALEVIERALSVRQTEALVRTLLNPKPESRKEPPSNDSDTRALERRLSDHLGAPVQIKQSDKGRGQLMISYSTLEELDGILRHLPGLSTD